MLIRGFRNYMLALASVGGTRNALTKGIIEDFEIDLPPLPTQRHTHPLRAGRQNRNQPPDQRHAGSHCASHFQGVVCGVPLPRRNGRDAGERVGEGAAGVAGSEYW